MLYVFELYSCSELASVAEALVETAACLKELLVVGMAILPKRCCMGELAGLYGCASDTCTWLARLVTCQEGAASGLSVRASEAVLCMLCCRQRSSQL